MVGATATRAAAAANKPRTTLTGTQDVKAEVAALSLARRRGKCAPIVDTKLTDAWLGFYVALTKSTGKKSTETTTQASTEAATEASLSEVGSSGDPSPHRRASIVSSARESWADASEDVDEVIAKKRTRRSRRRRTRGRGKRNRNAGAEEVDAEESDDADMQECSCIDEEETAPDAPREDSSSHKQATCASTRVPPTPPPALPPILPLGVASTGLLTPTRLGAILPMEASPISCAAVIVCTSPSALNTPAVLDASARTPPRLGAPFGSSPVARMMPSTPTASGSLTYQGGHAEYKGSHMMVTSPGSLWMGSPCHSHGVQAPSFFGTTCAPLQVNPMMDPMRSWLTGGMPTTDTELAMRLLAAAPETYED